MIVGRVDMLAELDVFVAVLCFETRLPVSREFEGGTRRVLGGAIYIMKVKKSFFIVRYYKMWINSGSN